MKSKAQVAADWTVTRRRIEAIALPASFSALVDASAQAYGDRVAWSFFERGESLTFTQVKDLSLRVAGLFRARGIKRGGAVALMVENGPAYLGGWIGLMRLGAATVPVNTRYTARELRHVLETSNARMLVIASALVPVFAEIKHQLPNIPDENVFVVDGDTHGYTGWDDLVRSAIPIEVSDSVGDLDDIANIQYTSGTTGFPKGCLLPQRYWLHAAITWGEYLEFPLTNVICNQRLFYIDGQFLGVTCLYKGATFHICSKPSAAKFSRWLLDYKIDYCFYFDPLFKMEPTVDENLNNLKLVQIFGFNRERHGDLEARYGTIAREAFGMSEYAPSLIMPLDAGVMVGSGSCGLEGPFTHARLIDDRGKPVAQGQTGELWLRSHAMMHGYVGDEQATAEAFEAGWFKTGDLFVQDEDGYFFIVGRKKDMVRKNSENIACREVEAVVRLLPEVLEAAMVPVKDDVVGEEPKIYVRLRAGLTAEDLPPDRLIAHCATELAPFKVPRYVAYVQEFPMTDSERVAKKLLIADVTDLRAGSYDRIAGQWL